MAFLLPYLQPYGIANEEELLHTLAYIMIGSGISAFIALMFVEAPYGKYAEKAAWFYGFHMDGKAAWILQECPSFLLVAYYWYTTATSSSSAAAVEDVTTISPRTVLLTMFLFHYFNRSFIYPNLIRGGKSTPVVVMLMAFVFCLWNGYMQGRYLTEYATGQGTNLLAPHFVIGFTLFLAGMAINWQSDSILRNLRKPGDTGYSIPRGGAFDFVSGANFFGEIIEWTGFAIAAWSLPAAAFAFFTFCNIGPRGAQHHKWYVTKFKGEYPADRKAVIPYIW